MNRQNVFWAAHEAHFGAPFSPEFKDLMTQMLAYQPYLRLNLVEVLMHPFFKQGGATAPMATKDETKAEMQVRSKLTTREVTKLYAAAIGAGVHTEI